MLRLFFGSEEFAGDRARLFHEVQEVVLER